MALEIFRLVGSVFVDTADADKSLKKTDKQATDFSKTLGKGLEAAGRFAAGVVAAAGAAAGAFVALAETTREYRTEQGKLTTAFETNGFEAEAALETYQALNGVLGDSGQAVEASNHLAKLCTTVGELSTWTDICTGVYATFGDSLPIEGLTEAANETAKTGALTGALADALNWAGVNEDAFQAKLDACSSEQERQALITKTLNGLYSDAADKYREVNGEVIAANEAQDRLNRALAQVGGAVEPVVTRFKSLGAVLLNQLMPVIVTVADAFIVAVDWMVDALEDASKWVADNSDKIEEWTGYVVAAGAGVAAFLAYMNWGSIMGAASGALNLATASINKMTTALLKNPIGMVIALIASLITYVMYLYNTNEDFRVFVDQMLASLWAKAMEVIDWIQKTVLPVIEPILSAIMGLLQAGIGWLSENVFPIVSAVITWLTDALGGFWSWLTSIFQSSSDTMGGIWSTITGFFQSAWDFIVGVWNACTPFFQGVWNGVILPVWGMIQEMIGAFQMAWDVIKLVWDYVAPFFGAIWEGIKAGVAILWTVLSTGFQMAWEAIKLIWDVVGPYFTLLWENLKAVFSVVATVLGGFFRTAWEAIKAVWDVAISFFTMVWAGIKAVFAVVKGVLSGDFSDAWKAIKNLWNKAKDFFGAVWKGIKGVFGSVGKWFGDTFKAAWEAIKKVFSNWGKFFSGLWDSIKDTFSAIGTKIGDAISTAVKSGINGVISMIEGTINFGVNLINGAIDLINLIPGVAVSKISPLSLPRLEKGGVLERGQVGLLEGNGAEAVVPLHQNQKWISAVARDMDAAVGGTSNSQVVVLLTDILDALSELAGAGIYLDGDAMVGRLAKKMDNELGRLQAKKARA